jgi:hypothetical protein
VIGAYQILETSRKFATSRAAPVDVIALTAFVRLENYTEAPSPLFVLVLGNRFMQPNLKLTNRRAKRHMNFVRHWCAAT